MKNLRTRMFRNLVVTLLTLTFTLPMFAYVEGDQVEYIGGSVSTPTPGTIGRLDMGNDKEFRFIGGTATISIAYDKIDSYKYTEDLAHHMGVLPTVAIVMFKYRQRRHYFRISYRDENDRPQSIVLEVPKTMPKAVSAVLETRVPNACIGTRSGDCRRK